MGSGPRPRDRLLFCSLVLSNVDVVWRAVPGLGLLNRKRNRPPSSPSHASCWPDPGSGARGGTGGPATCSGVLGLAVRPPSLQVARS